MTQRVVNYKYNTGNPVLPDGSVDVRDGIDNLQSLDVFMNATEDTYNQRDGNVVRTVAGMNNEFDAQILNMGFTRIGTFAAGATLTNPRQTLLWDIADGGDGQEYGWSGAFPKVVPAASTPTSTGGISVGAWVSRFDPALRIQLREAQRRSYAEVGYSLVDGSFEAGGTLVNHNDVLLQESTGKCFTGPAGVVAPGSVPVPGWVDVSARVGYMVFADYLTMVDSVAVMPLLSSGQLVSSGNTLWRVSFTSGTVEVDSGLYLSPVSHVHLGDFSIDSGDNASKLLAAINAANMGVLDLDGIEFSSSPVSASFDSLTLMSSTGRPKLTCVGAADAEFFLQLITSNPNAVLITNDFELDAANLCAKALYVQTSVTGQLWLSSNVKCVRAKQVSSTSSAAGHFLNGGFDYVQLDNPVAEEIISEGGSFVSSGIRSGQSGSAVSRKIVVNNPRITGVRPGNDGDGIALLQTFPFTVLGEYEVNGGRFENCHKRAIKTQCWKSIVREPYIVRTEAHTVFAGNIDIDCQYGNAEVINPTFDYSSHVTFPANGLVSLQGERGATEDNKGRAVNVVGGTCTVRDKDTGAANCVFSLSTYGAGDVVNQPSVRDFKFNGRAVDVCAIRPLASSTFNKNVVFDISFRGCEFERIDSAFFSLDRSGSGYAFTKGAAVTGCNVLSGSINLSRNITTQVGIDFSLTARNSGVGVPVRPTYVTNFATGIADNSTYAFSFKIPLNSSVEVTALYASSAGNSFHAARKSVVQCGDSAGDSQETNWNNKAGSVSFSISAALSGSEWAVTVSKPAGSSSSLGTVDLILQCPSGIKV